jgi:Protein of unknown function (DUF3102)/DNA N-6-adenine-methyltransferase (Dam)
MSAIERVQGGNLELDRLSESIRNEITQGEAHIYESLEHFMNAGELLIEAKAKLQHGEWLPWLDSECQCSERSAQRYMKLAQNRALIEAKNDTVSDLSLRRALAEIQELKKPTAKTVHFTGEFEWYSPKVFVDAAREVMGGIDLDPASCELANTVVGASRIFTTDDDGLKQSWAGTVFMNPPYRTELIRQFTSKLITHFKLGDVTAAIVLVNNCTETEWFQDFLGCCATICFPSKRIQCWGPENLSSPLQGQAFIYLGTEPRRFVEVFTRFGSCVVRA